MSLSLPPFSAMSLSTGVTPTQITQSSAYSSNGIPPKAGTIAQPATTSLPNQKPPYKWAQRQSLRLNPALGSKQKTPTTTSENASNHAKARTGKHKPRLTTPQIDPAKRDFAISAVADFVANTPFAKTCREPAYLSPADITLKPENTPPISTLPPTPITTVVVDYTKLPPELLDPTLKMWDGELFSSGDMSDDSPLGTPLLRADWLMIPLQAIQLKNPDKINDFIQKLPTGDFKVGPLYKDGKGVDLVIPKNTPQINMSPYSGVERDTDGDGANEINAQLATIAFYYFNHVVLNNPGNILAEENYVYMAFEMISPGHTDVINGKDTTTEKIRTFAKKSKGVMGFMPETNQLFAIKSISKQSKKGRIISYIDATKPTLQTMRTSTPFFKSALFYGTAPARKIGPPNVTAIQASSLFKSGIALFQNRFFYEHHGLGVLFTNRQACVGQFTDYQPDGFITCIDRVGSIFEGHFKHAIKHGPGTTIYSDGTVKKGTYKNGKLRGIVDINHSNGHTYLGTMKGTHKDGTGLITYPDGSSYSGQIKKDLWHGSGVKTKTDGTKIIGSFKKGVSIGPCKVDYASGHIYEGELTHELPNGFGKLTDPSTGYYQGNFVNGVMQGQGIYIYPNGNKYEGEFKNNLPDGLGTFFYPDGTRFKGEFQKEFIEGAGQIIYINGGSEVRLFEKTDPHHLLEK